MMRNMRINTGAKQESDSEDRAPLSATFQDEQANRQAQESSGEATTPETPESTELEDRFESLNSAVPPVPQSRLASTPRKPPHLTLQLPGPGSARKPPSIVGSLPSGLPASPAPSNKNLSLPSTVRPGSSNTTGTSGSKPLPFRVAFQDSPLASPAPVKTTFLERKKLQLGGLRTAKTPMTGVPQTPYSAYMPFTPVTPVTPHLVTRKERKMQKKQMGKSLLADNDLVKEEDEEWD